MLGAAGIASPDGGNGFRLRGAGASDFSGTITVGQGAKFEIQTTVAGPFSPAGTGTVVLTGGTTSLGNTTNGTYSDFLVRNTLGGGATATIGTNVEIAGTGVAVFNDVAASAANQLTVMGNLKIGAGQEVALYKSTTTSTPVRLEFTSVTLTGGNATFTPKQLGFGAVNVDGGDFVLDNIGEITAGSGIIMNGRSTSANGPAGTLFLNGNNSFTGGVTINSGVVQIGNAGALNSTTPQTVTFSASSTGTLRLGGTSVIGGGLVTNATPGTPVVENGNVTPATFTINTSGTPTFAGVLQNGTGTGAFSLTKTGSGTQTLTGNNTYTGNTTVNGGTLALSTAGTNNIPNSSLITVGASGTLNVTGVAGGIGLTLAGTQTLKNNGIVSGTVTVPSNTFVAGTGTYANNVVFTGGAEKVTISGASADKILITGAADFSGSGGITMALTAPATLPFYDVMVYGSLIGAPTLNTPTIGRTNFSFAPSPPPNTIRINVTGGPANIIWNNAGSTGDGLNWDVATNVPTNKNWSNSGIPDFYFDFDNVTFNDSNNAHYSVNIAVPVAPGSVTVNNSSGDYVLGGASIDGIGGLTKSGTSALTLSSANSYSGGTTLNQGTLNLGAPTSIGTGPLTINGGAIDNSSGGDMTLTNNNSETWAASFTFTGTSNLNLGTGPVTLNANPTITTLGTNALTVGGIIGNGTGNSITKAGTGTLILSAANTFTGGLTINAGSVRATVAGATGSGLATVNASSTLVIGGTLNSPITLNGGSLGAANNAGGTASTLGGNTFTSGDVTAAAATTSTIYLNDPAVLTPTNTNNSEMILTGALHGSGDIVVVGGSTSNNVDGGGGFRLRGTGASDYSGTISYTNTNNFGSKGELQTNVPGPFSPAGTGKIKIAAGTYDTSLVGTYTEFNLRNNNTAGVNTVFGNDVEVTGTGLADLNLLGNGSTSITMGNLKIGTGQILGVNKTSMTLIFPTVTLAGSATFSPATAGFGPTGPANLVLGTISESAGGSGITMDGGATTTAGFGVLFLNGNNSFTGGLTINNGTVQVGNAGALNSTTPQAVTFGLNAGSTGNNTATLQLSGFNVTIGGLNSDASSPGAAAVENANVTPATLTVSNTAANTYAGVLRDGTGGGALSLVKTNAGTLILLGNNGYTGSTTVNGGTLQLGNASSSGALSGTSGVSGLAGATLDFNLNSSTDLTFSAPITGAIAIAKDNSNTVTLSGISTTSGATSVNAGALVVTGALGSGATVNVASNATLGGAGDGLTTGKVGNVILASGAFVHPGALITDGSIGKLTANSMTINGVDFRSDLTSTTVGDLVAVTNTATFAAGSSTTFTPIFTGAPSAGLYTLLTAGNLSVAGGATLTLTPPSNSTRLNFALVTATGTNGSVKLNVTGTSADLTWTGAQTNDWDLVNHTNWKSGSNPNEQYFDLDNVTFDDSSSVAKHTVNLTGSFIPGSVTVNANTDYTLNNGGIGGVGGLTKSGTGKLTLNSTNSYTGATLLQNGTTVLGNASALPGTSSLTLGSGSNSATLDLNGNAVTVGSLATSGSGSANTIGNSSAFSPASITVSGGTTTFAGVIKDTLPGGSQTVSLTVAGGALTLSGNNTYTGTTSVSSGATLQLGDGGTAGGTVSTSIQNDGVLAFNRSDSLTIVGAINGQGSLQQLGGGTTILTGANNYAGPTTISAGTLQVGNGGTTGSLGSNTGPLTNNGVLAFNRSATDTITIPTTQIISGTGDLQNLGPNTLTVNSANTFTGNVLVNAGTLRLAAGASLGAGTITVNSGGTFANGAATRTNPIILNGGTLGSLGLGTANGTVYTSGDVTVTGNSTVWIGDPQNPAAAASEVEFTGTLHGNGNIVVMASTAQANPDGGAGFRLQGPATSDFTGTITLGNAVKGELQTTVAGPFSPAGSGKIVMTAGTFTGTLMGTYSELNLRNNRASGNTILGNDIEVSGTGFVTLNPLNATSPAPQMSTLGNLKVGDGQILGVNKNNGGTNTVAFQSVTLTGGNATLSPTTANYGSTGGGIGNLVLGPIGESVAGSGFIVDGQSTVFLNGANTYTGPTAVNRGTLQLGVSNSIPTGSNLSLGAGALAPASPPVFATAGFSNTLGTLTVGSDLGTLDFGNGSSTLHFAASDASTWLGTLTVNNWTGMFDRLFFGSSATGLGASITNPISQLQFSLDTHLVNSRILSTGEVIPVLSLLKGDYNQDGVLSSADVAAGLQALTDLSLYQSSYAMSLSDLAAVGDFDSSGTVTNRDIQPLLDLVASVGGGSVAAVPEPASFLLLSLGGLALLAAQRRRRITQRAA